MWMQALCASGIIAIAVSHHHAQTVDHTQRPGPLLEILSRASPAFTCRELKPSPTSSDVEMSSKLER